MDPWLRYLNCVQALRRRCECMVTAMGGALGAAITPLPHQLFSVNRILTDTQIRHLIADEVGLGKTIQTIMIINALRCQNPEHRTIVVAPERLLAQWNEECWVRGHLKSVTAFSKPSENQLDYDSAKLTLVRPQDLVKRDPEDEVFELHPEKFNLLVIDEPQSMPINVVDRIVVASKQFRQILVLTATPRLGIPSWFNRIMRIIEPEAVELASIADMEINDFLIQRERDQLALFEQSKKTRDDKILSFKLASINRRIIRSSRIDWQSICPNRSVESISFRASNLERERFQFARDLLRLKVEEVTETPQQWTKSRAIQRSSRSARPVLRELESQELGEVSGIATSLLKQSSNDPVDSRFDRLLDLLSEHWIKWESDNFIIVCDDNLTIDMLRDSLPKYFPKLKGEISNLRRPRERREESLENIQEMRELMDSLQKKENHILLIGDWIQEGLNLNFFSRNLIFYALPWDVETINQLIGRLDRISYGINSEGDAQQRNVRIWSLLPEESLDASVIIALQNTGVFNKPLPSLSEEDTKNLNKTIFELVTKNHSTKLKDLKKRFDQSSSSTQSCLDHCGLSEYSDVMNFFDNWKKIPPIQPNPAMKSNNVKNPVERSEISMDAWLWLIGKSGDFHIGDRRDKKDLNLSFKTIWYPDAPWKALQKFEFILPEVGREKWLTDHVPFLIKRHSMAKPPLKIVNTDESETNGRALDFLDHGNEIHDAIVRNYINFGRKSFDPTNEIPFVKVKLPHSHPASKYSTPILITAAYYDSFPDYIIPDLLNTEEANSIFDEATTRAQTRDLTFIRDMLQETYLSTQRWIRHLIPNKLELRATQINGESAIKLEEESTLNCFRAFEVVNGKHAYVKGTASNIPQSTNQVLKVVLDEQISSINTSIDKLCQKHNSKLISESKIQRECQKAQYENQLEIQRKELSSFKRADFPDGSQGERMFKGRVASAERGIKMLELCRDESKEFCDNLISGNFGPPEPIILSVLVKFFYGSE